MKIDIPLRIGDRAWCIRNYKSVLHATSGMVSEIYFSKDMELVLVVKNVGRGIYGKSVFGTRNEAMAEVHRRFERACNHERN